MTRAFHPKIQITTACRMVGKLVMGLILILMTVPEIVMVMATLMSKSISMG